MRVVIKVGTNTLCHRDGRLKEEVMEGIAKQVQGLAEVVIVSSGAIGLGRGILGIHDPPQDITVRQAAAAVGQPHLVTSWGQALAPRPVAQVLLTRHTFSARGSYLNLKRCVNELLARRAIPIVNENDAVSIDEIDASFGDNDRLAVMTAAKLDADLLIILSDVDGLWSRPPGHPDAKRVYHVTAITEEIRQMAGVKAGAGARGGMASKLDAIDLATRLGVPVHLAGGHEAGIVAAILEGQEVGTRFDAVGAQRSHARWLHMAKPEGSIAVDAGAATAIRDGNHLLPAGILGVAGSFDVEAVVDITHDGVPIARAVSSLSSHDLALCKGMKSHEAAKALGIAGNNVNVTRKGRLIAL